MKLGQRASTADDRSRYWEIDLMRGISVVAMIAFHSVWNLWYFDIVDWNILGPWGQTIARTIGSMFLSLVGVSLSISYHQARLHLHPSQLFLKYIKRGLVLFGWGMVITWVTRLVLDAPVYFGILHLIGTATILAIPLLPHGKIAGMLGLGIIIANLLIPRLPYTAFWLLPLGLTRISQPMSDYYPLFPWFGVVLVGLYLGDKAYPSGKRSVPLPPPKSHLVAGLVYLGRNSLLIYLTHQPLLFGLTFLFARTQMLN